jgi:hypothetical protein
MNTNLKYAVLWQLWRFTMKPNMFALGIVGLLLADPFVGSGQPEGDKEAQARALIEEQKMTQTVEKALRHARRDIASDPAGALSHLRNALVRVRDHPELGAKVRDVLRTRLQTALRETAAKVQAIKLAEQERSDSVKENIEKARRIYRDYPKKALRLLRSTTLQVWDDPQISDAYRKSFMLWLVDVRSELTKQGCE